MLRVAEVCFFLFLSSFYVVHILNFVYSFIWLRNIWIASSLDHQKNPKNQKTTMNIGVQAFVWMYAFISLEKIPRSEMIELYGRYVVISKGKITRLFSQVVVQFCIATSSLWEF